MSKKRGQGEGSIYQMQDGRWRAAVTTGKDINGKLKRKVFTAATRHEVADELTKALRDQQRGININPRKQTVAQFLNDWLASVKSDVSPGSYVNYEGVIRLHIVPAIGEILLSKLSAQQIGRLKQQLLEVVVDKGPGVKKLVEGAAPLPPRHLSTTTVRNCLVILRMALDHACKLDLMPRNVAMLVDFPKVTPFEIAPYGPEEAARFLEAAKGERLGAFFTVATALGLRKGESLGLKWSAIDFEHGTLAVRQALQRIKIPGAGKGSLVVKEPKRSSRRKMNLPQVCVSALLAHRSQQEQERLLAGSRWHETDFVFTTGIGTPLDAQALERPFARILAAAKLPRIRIHDLRHTAATLLLAQGVHPRVVMELLGHSQIAVTMNTYSHVIPALRKDAAEQMDAALNPVATRVATRVATKEQIQRVQ